MLLYRVQPYRRLGGWWRHPAGYRDVCPVAWGRWGLSVFAGPVAGHVRPQPGLPHLLVDAHGRGPAVGVVAVVQSLVTASQPAHVTHLHDESPVGQYGGRPVPACRYRARVIYPGQPRITGYQTLAIHLRQRIAAGDWQPGQRLPSEEDLRQEHGLAIGTVNRAVNELRRMGVVDYVRGYGVVVREPREVERVAVPPGCRITARPATTEEQQEWGEGVSALIVWHDDGTGDVYPGDRTEFYTSTDG